MRLDLAREQTVVTVPAAPSVAVSTVTLPRRGGAAADLDSAFSLAGST